MQVGRYQVVEEIARGGMGVVYRAVDPANGEAVALKVMLGGQLANAGLRKRFTREAEALGRISHENVVQIRDSGVTSRGDPFLAMEFVEGESLQARLDAQGPMDPDDAVAVVAQLCDAVGACHAAGVLHRDVKPDNVLVALDGALKLTDFGLVRDVDPSLSRTALTVEGRFLGSPGFWAPEQAAGKLDQIGACTDVYGLGATLFALLTGRPPHDASTFVEILAAITKPCRPPSSLNPAVPKALDAVSARALSVDPSARYPGPRQLKKALEGATSAPAPPARSKRVILALRAGIVALAIAAVVVGRGGDPGSEPRAPAPEGAAPVEPVASDASQAVALVELAQASAARGDLERAKSEMAAAIALDPQARYYYVRASICDRSGDRVGALDDMTRAIELDPEFAEAYRSRAAVHNKLRHFRSAVEDSTQAIRLRPDVGGSFLDRGAYYLALGESMQALADLDRAVDLLPSSARAYMNRGIARGNLGEFGRALEDFERAWELDPEDPEISGLLADARRAHGATSGDPASAKRISRSTALVSRATALSKQDRAAEALTLLNEAIRVAPENGGAYYARAQLRERMRDVRGVLVDCSEAIRCDRRQPGPFRLRARMKMAARDFRGAVTDFGDALRLVPRDVDSLLMRGTSQLALDNYPGAILDFSAALAVDPALAGAYQNRAVAYLNLGRLAEAVSDCDEAIRLQPDYSVAYHNRGIAKSRMNDLPGAIQDLERVLELDPANAGARAALERLRGRQ